jgi:CDP-glycerol glycerophosphotransferase
VFFVEEDKKRRIHERVHSVLGIPNDVKIVAYMPTFRDTGRVDCYNVNFESLTKTLEAKFGGKWVIVVKVHPKIKRFSKKIFNFSENVVDASEYPDAQELLSAIDVCITDYSSCIFDFMLTRRPGFIFATDIEIYNNERGFYYPLESTPFPIATTNEELANNILNFDEKKYKSNVEEFLKEKGCIEDGHSSERVVDLIEKLMTQ